MHIGQGVCLSLMGPCKFHAALSVDVPYTKIHSDGFNGSKHRMEYSLSSENKMTRIEFRNFQRRK